MFIQVVQEGAVAVLKLSGHLVIGEAEEHLSRAVDRLLSEGHTRLVLDLSAVDALDSAGIGALIRTFSAARDIGGEAKFAHPTERTRTLLEITKLSSVFDIYSDADSALSSFEWR